MSDRNFKLRQMYADYLDQRRDDKLINKVSNVPKVESFDGLSEEDKKKLAVLKMEDEEKETFENIPSMIPILIKEKDYDIKKATTESTSKAVVLDENETDAKRLLEIFINMRIFESKSFRSDDILLISNFFEDSKEPPSDRLISFFDYVFNQSLNFITSMGTKAYELVDEKILTLINDPLKLKPLLLGGILRNPEFMPEAWGKAKAVQRKNEQIEMDKLRKIEDQKNIAADKEKEENSLRKAKSSKSLKSVAAKSQRSQKSGKSSKSKKKIKGQTEDENLKTTTEKDKSETRSKKKLKEKECQKTEKTEVGNNSISKKRSRATTISKKKSLKDTRSYKSKKLPPKK